LPADQDVGGLDISVDDALVVRVLHRPADAGEQPQPLAGPEALVVAEVRERHALDQLHDEVRARRAAGVRGGSLAGVEHPGDVGVVHQGQGLAFGLEAGDYLLAVHAGPEDLQGDPAADRLPLLGPVDDTEAALAERLQELVGAEDRSGCFRGASLVGGRPLEEMPRPLVGVEERLDAGPQGAVAAAGAVEVRRLLERRCAVEGLPEKDLDVAAGVTHGRTLRGPLPQCPGLRRRAPAEGR
jgi:hypothetical protein